MSIAISRPRGISLIALFFLVEAIVALGIAAFLLLSPAGASGFNNILERLGLSSALSSLLALPALLTAGVAGLVFRGLWHCREWARVAATVMVFLVTLLATAVLAFLVAFSFSGPANLLLAGLGVLACAGLFVYLLVTGFEQEQPEAELAALPPLPSEQPLRAPTFEPANAAAPFLVPPPPRPAGLPVARPEAATVASLQPTRQLQAPQAAPAAQALAWLVVRQGPEMGLSFSLYADRTLVIGRDASRAQAVLSDNTVSGRHAEVRFDEGDFVIHDVGSTNGTYVDSQPVVRHPLQDGDEIRLGATVLLFTTLPFTGEAAVAEQDEDGEDLDTGRPVT